MDQRLTKRKKLPNSYVISVGNLSVGGTGKTPFTIYLANTIYKLHPDKDIVILSRGYGGKKSNEGMLVLENSNPEDSGDEPLLMKRALPFATVIIGKDRYSAFMQFMKTSKAKTIVILDDGFQHHKLQRDYDYVLIDSLKQFGNGFTLPIGMLREKPTALNRANSVVLTKTEQAMSEKLLSLEQNLKNYNPNLSFHRFSFNAEMIKRKSVDFEIDIITEKKIYIFSGIGNPSHFQKMVISYKPSKLKAKFFNDHYSFTISDIREIINDATEFDFILCTEKDYVKIEKFEILNQFEKIYYVGLNNEITDTYSFENEINKLF